MFTALMTFPINELRSFLIDVHGIECFTHFDKENLVNDIILYGYGHECINYLTFA